jgi:N-methylhydantoinase A
VEDGDGSLSLFKSPTTPDDPARGVLEVLESAALSRGQSRAALLASGELLVHATTHALNALLTGGTARTGLVVTEGHEDILLLREGGRPDAFDFSLEYPDPYVPRELTFGLRERVGAHGEVVIPLTPEAATGVARRLAAAEVEAVAVSLLWSVANPAHEALVGEVLARELAEVPVTLSHALNPTVREYRRTSSTAIDASLRPLMDGYFGSFERRLREAGFGGRILASTSTGALLELDALVAQPVRILNSGPAMAPVAGRFAARRDLDAETAIVADAGGTSFDVSVVRGGRLPRTREAWIGPRLLGWMTGFPALDVRSVGAGGGSLARVDGGGLLHVGPESAGAVPGPAAYGLGGTRPTMTDAALVLGYLDPAAFLGGAMELDRDAAVRAVTAEVAEPLGVEVEEAAASIIELATERMVRAIEDVSVKQGIDPADAVLVGGGGAAGLNLAAIARRLGCESALLPATAAALSAEGALVSDIARDFHLVRFVTTDDFDRDAANEALAELERRCRAFVAGLGSAPAATRIEFFAEARYFRQIWELEVPVGSPRFEHAGDVAAFVDDFHAHHEATFAFRDPGAPIEVVGWRAHVSCEVERGRASAAEPATATGATGSRRAWFPGAGALDASVADIRAMSPAEPLAGPVIVEAGLTTVIVGPGETVRRLPSGALLIHAEENR